VLQVLTACWYLVFSWLVICEDSADSSTFLEWAQVGQCEAAPSEGTPSEGGQGYVRGRHGAVNTGRLDIGERKREKEIQRERKREKERERERKREKERERDAMRDCVMS
jgi:hypothetical protein